MLLIEDMEMCSSEDAQEILSTIGSKKITLKYKAGVDSASEVTSNGLRGFKLYFECSFSRLSTRVYPKNY